MPGEPWREWVPGVLAKHQVEHLANAEYLELGLKRPDIDLSSFDLRIGTEAFRLLSGSVKPWGEPDYRLRVLHVPSLAEKVEPGKDGIFCLNRHETYVFPLQETLRGLVRKSPIHGRATAKSSIGRLDVLARLIADGMSGYEVFDPSRYSSGELFLEVTPNSFPIRVKPGSSLCQLRLFHGHPDASEIRGSDIFQACVAGATPGDGTLSANLDPVKVGGLQAAAFRADDESAKSKWIDLWNGAGLADPCAYFRFEQAENNRLKLEPTSFYIIRSRERLSIPRGVAVYCRATDESLGEMRIHYAGFAHPGFGKERNDGTPLIFEVRGHDVPVSLRDGEVMAKLSFYRMSEDATVGASSTYGSQELKLSRYFRDWPASLRRKEDGMVEPSESAK